MKPERVVSLPSPEPNLGSFTFSPLHFFTHSLTTEM
jgi:hypothetical protein